MHHLGVLGRHGERADTGIAEEIHDLRLLHPTNLPAHPAPHSVHVWEEAQMPKRRAIRRECHIVPGERPRSEEHTSELQSLMRISYAVFCLKKKTHHHITTTKTRTQKYKVSNHTTHYHKHI